MLSSIHIGYLNDFAKFVSKEKLYEKSFLLFSGKTRQQQSLGTLLGSDYDDVCQNTSPVVVVMVTVVVLCRPRSKALMLRSLPPALHPLDDLPSYKYIIYRSCHPGNVLVELNIRSKRFIMCLLLIMCLLDE